MIRCEDQSWRHKTPTQEDKTLSKSVVLLMTHGDGVGWKDKSSQSLSAPTRYKDHIQKQRMVANVKDPREVMSTHLHPLMFLILARCD